MEFRFKAANSKNFNIWFFIGESYAYLFILNSLKLLFKSPGKILECKCRFCFLVWKKSCRRKSIVFTALEGEMRSVALFFLYDDSTNVLRSCEADRSTTSRWKENLHERVIFQVGRYGRPRRMYAVARAKLLPLETLESDQGRSHNIRKYIENPCVYSVRLLDW